MLKYDNTLRISDLAEKSRLINSVVGGYPKCYAALETALETAKLQGCQVFDVLVELMGKPVFNPVPDVSR